MQTIRECRERAQDCLRLAAMATDFFAQDALVRRAADCETMAATLKPHRTNKHNRHRTRLHEQRQNNVRSM
jgi:hypothetical protein